MPLTGGRRRGARAAASLAARAALLGSAGCYAYEPASAGRGPAGWPVGRPVEVALTDSGSLVLGRAIGPSAATLAGTLVADSAGGLVIAVRQVRRRDGGEATWRGERVLVPRAVVAGVRERRFSRTRSVLAGAGIIAGLVAARAAFAAAGGSNAGRDQRPGPGSPQ